MFRRLFEGLLTGDGVVEQIFERIKFGEMVGMDHVEVLAVLRHYRCEIEGNKKIFVRRVLGKIRF